MYTINNVVKLKLNSQKARKNIATSLTLFHLLLSAKKRLKGISTEWNFYNKTSNPHGQILEIRTTCVVLLNLLKNCPISSSMDGFGTDAQGNQPQGKYFESTFQFCYAPHAIPSELLPFFSASSRRFITMTPKVPDWITHRTIFPNSHKRPQPHRNLRRTHHDVACLQNPST
jgi:hypothetical protein